VSRAKKSIVDTFSRAYAEASPDEQAALRVWMRDIIRPQKKPRVDVAKARRFEKDSVEARNRPILEFPLSVSHREIAKTLQAEGWFSLKTTVYYIEYRVRQSQFRCARNLPDCRCKPFRANLALKLQ
jgi:hypothetical protein